MPLTYCQRCDKSVAKARSGVCPSCGSRLSTYYRPGEKVEVKPVARKKTGRDIGQAIGSLLTGGSSLGVAVGHTIGKALEGRADFLKEGLTFTPLPPEPQGQLDIRISPDTLKKASKILDDFFKPGTKKALKSKQRQRKRK